MPIRPKSKLEETTESELFAVFREACDANEPKPVLNKLIAWLGWCCEDSAFASIAQFAEAVGDDDVAREIFLLQKASASLSTDWSAGALCRAVTAARKRLLKSAPTEG